MDIFYEVKCILVPDLNSHTQEILKMLSDEWEQLKVEKTDIGYFILYGRFSEFFNQVEKQGAISRKDFMEGDE